jgi:hypothetical protein
MVADPHDLESDIDDVAESGSTDSARSARELEAEIARIRSSPEGLQFEGRRGARRGRLERASDAAQAEAARAFGSAHRIGDAIPFGQPILVGHHSEARHRRDIRRIDQSMQRGVEATRRGEDLARRAAQVGSAGISSDDPAATTQLSRKLLDLEAAQAQMKAANLAIRKYAKSGVPAQVGALVALGFSEERAHEILRPDFAGRVGFPSYALSNNNAEIARVKKRVAELSARASAPERDPIRGEIEGLSFTLSEDRDLHRTQIRFSGKPGDELRARLRSAGFLWAPSQSAWQRQLSPQAWHRAFGALGLS